MLNKLLLLSCFVFMLAGCYVETGYYHEDYVLVHRGYYSSPGIWVAPVYYYHPYHVRYYREDHGRHRR